MKRVVGAAVIFSGAFGSGLLRAESGNSPPTAQFPPTEPAAPAAPPEAPPASPETRTAPPAAPAPAPPAAPSLPYPPYPANAYPPNAYYPAPELVPTQPPPSDSEQVFSLTISPLHLILPIVQLTGELRVAPHFGISVIAGYGEIGMDENGHSLANKYSAFELGTRAIWYPIKKFKSLQLGGELVYLKVDSEASSTSFADTASGVVSGPFVGYKLITSGGFTFFGQLGVAYAFAHNDSDESARRFLPIANVDVGWSF